MFPSVRVETLCSKQLASLNYRLRGGRLNAVERIVELQLLPFEAAHLMEGQDLDSFHVTQAGGEFRNLDNVFGLIC